VGINLYVVCLSVCLSQAILLQQRGVLLVDLWDTSWDVTIYTDVFISVCHVTLAVVLSVRCDVDLSVCYTMLSAVPHIHTYVFRCPSVMRHCED